MEKIGDNIKMSKKIVNTLSILLLLFLFTFVSASSDLSSFSFSTITPVIDSLQFSTISSLVDQVYFTGSLPIIDMANLITSSTTSLLSFLTFEIATIPIEIIECNNLTSSTCSDICSDVESCEEVCSEINGTNICEEVCSIKEVCSEVCVDKVDEVCTTVIINATIDLPNNTNSSIDEKLLGNSTLSVVTSIVDFMITPLSIVYGELLEVSARLVYENDTPIVGEDLYFYSEDVLLGYNLTDSDGKSLIRINSSLLLNKSLNITLDVIFNGTDLFAKSSESKLFNFIVTEDEIITNGSKAIIVENDTGSSAGFSNISVILNSTNVTLSNISNSSNVSIIQNNTNKTIVSHNADLGNSTLRNLLLGKLGSDIYPGVSFSSLSLGSLINESNVLSDSLDKIESQNGTGFGIQSVDNLVALDVLRKYLVDVELNVTGGIVTLRGVNASEILSVYSSSGVFYLNNVTLDSATLKFLKSGYISSILECGDADWNGSDCLNWTESGLNFSEDLKHVWFEVDHFSGFRVNDGFTIQDGDINITLLSPSNNSQELSSGFLVNISVESTNSLSSCEVRFLSGELEPTYTTKHSSSWIFDIAPTPDGGYVLGDSHSGFTVSKFSSEGVSEWNYSHPYGNPNFAWANDVYVDTDGSIVAAGRINTSTSQYIGTVVKLSSTGSELWRFDYERANTAIESDDFSSVISSGDGGYIVFGEHLNGGNYLSRFKLDSSGNIVWNFSDTLSSLASYQSVKVSDGYVVTQQVSGSSYEVKKYNTAGTSVASDSFSTFAPTGIDVFSDGTLIVVGQEYTGGYDGYVRKYNADLSVNFTVSFAYDQRLNFYDVLAGPEDSIIISATHMDPSFKYDAVLWRLNSTGGACDYNTTSNVSCYESDEKYVTYVKPNVGNIGFPLASVNYGGGFISAGHNMGVVQTLHSNRYELNFTGGPYASVNVTGLVNSTEEFYIWCNDTNNDGEISSYNVVEVSLEINSDIVLDWGNQTPDNNSAIFIDNLYTNVSIASNASVNSCELRFLSGGFENYSMTVNGNEKFATYNVSNLSVGQYIFYGWCNDSNNATNVTDIRYVTYSNINLSSISLSSETSRNLTTENLTAIFTGLSENTRVFYDWKLNNVSVKRLDMPFDANTTHNSTYVRDYTYSAGDEDFYYGDLNGVMYDSTGGYNSKGAFVFDGVNDWINVNSDGASGEGDIPLTSDFSTSAWVKRDTFTTLDTIFATREVDSNGRHYYMEIETADTLRCGFYGATYDISSTTTIADSNWHFLTCTYDWESRALKAYVDGEHEGTKIIAGNPDLNDPTETSIGARGGLTDYFDGTIDEVTVWNITLEDKQVKALYDSTFNVVVANQTVIGDTWSVCGTANDNVVDGPTVCSNSVNVGPSTPFIHNLILNESTDNSTLYTWVNATGNSTDNVTLYGDYYRNGYAVYEYSEIWNFTVDYSSTSFIRNIVVDNDGYTYLFAQNGAGTIDYTKLYKLYPNGTLLDTRSFDYNGNNSYPGEMLLFNNTYLYMSMVHQNLPEHTVLKLNLDLTEVWNFTETLNESERFGKLEVDPAGDIYYSNIDGSNSYSIYTAKIYANGSKAWSDFHKDGGVKSGPYLVYYDNSIIAIAGSSSLNNYYVTKYRASDGEVELRARKFYFDENNSDSYYSGDIVVDNVGDFYMHMTTRTDSNYKLSLFLFNSTFDLVSNTTIESSITAINTLNTLAIDRRNIFYLVSGSNSSGELIYYLYTFNSEGKVLKKDPLDVSSASGVFLEEDNSSLYFGGGNSRYTDLYAYKYAYSSLSFEISSDNDILSLQNFTNISSFNIQDNWGVCVRAFNGFMYSDEICDGNLSWPTFYVPYISNIVFNSTNGGNTYEENFTSWVNASDGDNSSLFYNFTFYENGSQVDSYNGPLWEYEYDAGDGEQPEAIDVDSHGNVFAFGAKRVFLDSDENLTIFKFNATGGILWNRTDRFFVVDEEPIDMRVDSNDDVITVGMYSNSLLFVKYDGDTGDLKYVKSKDGVILSNGNGEMIIDSSDNIYVMLFDRLMKLDSSATTVWDVNISGTEYGGTSANLEDIAFTPDGNLIIIGEHVKPGIDGVVVARYWSNNGTLMSSFNYTYNNYETFGHAIEADSSGIYIAGSSNYINSDYEPYVAKLNYSGSVTWHTEEQDGGGGGTDVISDLLVDEFGNVYMAGNYDAATSTDRGFLNKYNILGERIFNINATAIQTEYIDMVLSNGTMYTIRTNSDASASAIDWVIEAFNVTNANLTTNYSANTLVMSGYIPNYDLREGQNWSYCVNAYDGHNYSNQVCSNYLIVEAPLTISFVNVTPDNYNSTNITSFDVNVSLNKEVNSCNVTFGLSIDPVILDKSLNETYIDMVQTGYDSYTLFSSEFVVQEVGNLFENITTFVLNRTAMNLSGSIIQQVEAAADGGYYVSSTAVNFIAGLSKLDTSYNLEWHYNFSDGYDDWVVYVLPITMTNGDVVVAIDRGQQNSTLVRLSSTGSLLWSTEFEGKKIWNDNPLTEDSDGHIIYGTENKEVDSNGPNSTLYKVDGATGSVIWATVIDGPSVFNRIRGVGELPDGTYWANMRYSGGFQDMLYVINRTGSVISNSSRTGYFMDSFDYGPNGTIFSGGYYSNGTTYFPYIEHKYPNGTIISNYTYPLAFGTSIGIYDVIYNPNGIFVSLGRTYNGTGFADLLFKGNINDIGGTATSSISSMTILNQSGEYFAQQSFSGLSEGVYHYYVNCSSDFEQQFNLSRTIRIDQTPPTVNYVKVFNETPTFNGLVYQTFNVSFNASFDDLSNISSVTIVLWEGDVDGTNLTSESMVELDSFNKVWKSTFTTLSSWDGGLVNYTIYANDSVGYNTNYSSTFTLLEFPGIDRLFLNVSFNATESYATYGSNYSNWSFLPVLQNATTYDDLTAFAINRTSTVANIIYDFRVDGYG
ncbi:MAG: hypothetical protein ACI9P9_000292, partial [Patescibacteria group bacterium]